MTLYTTDAILNVSLFGSAARGDTDPNSDLDVLVVVRDGSGTSSSKDLDKYFFERWGTVPSISWYGLNKLRTLYQEGDLFAWHLHLEAKSITGKPLQDLVGTPRNYGTAADDIRELRDLAASVEERVISCPQNSVFEMGILYVCARNIAMPATWCFLSTPSFGRYSPYELPCFPFPVARDVYERMIRCRMASQRGADPPEVTDHLVLQTQNQLMLWSESLLQAIKTEGNLR